MNREDIVIAGVVVQQETYDLLMDELIDSIRVEACEITTSKDEYVEEEIENLVKRFRKDIRRAVGLFVDIKGGE